MDETTIVPGLGRRPRRSQSAKGHYRALFEAAPDPVFLVAADGPDAGRILDANHRAAAMHGYTREELLTLHIGDLDVGEDAALVRKRLQSLIALGEARFEVRHRRKDGSEFPVEVSARLHTVNGRRCVVAFNRDITDRHLAQQRLQEDRVRLEIAARAGGIGFWDWNLTTNAVHFSSEWKAQIGYAPDEIAPHYEEWRRRLHPADLPAALAAVTAHLDGQTAMLDQEFRLRHKDGSYRWIQARGQLLRDANGAPVSMLGCHVDITERKVAEDHLRETELLLRSFYDSPGVLRGIVELTDDEIVHVSGNVVTGEFFGVAPQRLAGMRATELGLPRAAIDLWIGHYRQCERECRPVSFDSFHAAPDGQRSLFCTVTHIGALVGRPRFAYAAFDRTAQELADAKAAETAERMRAIYETEPECIKTVAVDGRLLDMNPAGLRMVEADHLDEIRHQQVLDLVHPEDRVAFAALHRQVAAGDSGTLEFRIEGLKGTKRWMETHSVPLRNPQGTITSVLSVTRDITDRKLAEQERATMARQLEQLQRLEAIGTLSGGIAHDFNNILTTISGNVELSMLESVEPAAQQQYLREIRQASDRARALVRQILTFGRRQEPDRRAIDLRPVLQEATSFLRATISAAIQIELQVEANLPAVLADPAQIHQVLVNLCTNAWHAMEGGAGTMTLRLAAVELDADAAAGIERLRPGRYVCLSVSDTGVGMDEATQKRIFEPFFTTKPVGKGTGLGLSVVHGIVRNHEGGITTNSRPGAGTTICCYLPVAHRHTKTKARPRNAPAPGSTVVGSGERILLVDDEPAILRVTHKLLEGYGYRVTTCEQPTRALTLVAHAPGGFDLVVTDHEMPGMHGLMFARHVHELAPELPILMCSGYVKPEVLQAAAEHGIQRVLQKPVGSRELAAAIQDLLQAPISPS